MADVLPLNFPIPGENAVASYNYEELASGLGYIEFYGLSILDGTTPDTEYFLTTSEIYSQDIELTSTATTYSFYSSPFNLPRVVEGRAYVELPFGAKGGSGDTAAATVAIKHYDGSTATTLDTTKTETLEDPGTNGTNAEVQVLKFNLAETNFKIGDQLLITITTERTGSAVAVIALDPKNREGTQMTENNGADSRVFKAGIPFKINL